ncbi:MAG: alpha/beta hydrolase [Desulfobacteraceae bacterium]|jgi:pimeloyl-ACP methyl ester carboxylesterase
MELNVRGETLRVLESGPQTDGGKPTLVFIHGAGGDGTLWDEQEKDLGTRYTVLRLELPAHGGSSGKGEEQISDYVRWVEAVLKERVDPGSYILIGHSMGGAIAMEFAAGQPAGLVGLVLVGTGAKLGVSPIIFRLLREDPEGFIQTIDRAALGPSAGSKVRKAVEASIRRCSPDVILGDFLACDRFDMRDRMGRIRVPVLIVCGEEDRLTPPTYSEYLHREIEDSRIVEIPEAGHMVMLEAPEKVNREMEAFVKRVTSRIPGAKNEFPVHPRGI